jgi:hypothetical protein
MITPYEKEHYEFLDSLLFELYDEETRNRIYDFYEKHDVNVYLPRQLELGNWLEYIIEFRLLTLSTDRFKIRFKNGEHSIWRLD